MAKYTIPFNKPFLAGKELYYIAPVDRNRKLPQETGKVEDLAGCYLGILGLHGLFSHDN